MVVLSLLSNLVLWAVVLFLGFLLLGTLRALARLRWRLEQLEATTPSRLGRRGLRRGAKAPDFTLPSVEGGEIALRSFAGRDVLLVFMQSGCAPCRSIVPELNRLQRSGEVQVLAVQSGDPEAARTWAGEVEARFPVLLQEGYDLSRRYEVFAAPFAFLIDGQGVIVSKGIVSDRQYIRFVLAENAAAPQGGDVQADLVATQASES